jgi:hypothetical protein
MVSDNPNEVWLSPERLKAARGLLNWSVADLVRKVGSQGCTTAEIQRFEDYGVPLSGADMAAILSVLLLKVEFTITEGEPGVCRKPHVARALGLGRLEFGGPLVRRPAL